MKRCPVCNRTYSDETLSFCLEDGSLLSAPYNLHEEQETFVKPISAELPPTQFFSPRALEHNEIPTIVSSKNVNPVYRQPAEIQSGQTSTAKSLGFLFGKNRRYISLLLFVSLFTILVVFYTSSFELMMIGIFLIVLISIGMAVFSMKSK